jgi:ribosome-associated protein
MAKKKAAPAKKAAAKSATKSSKVIKKTVTKTAKASSKKAVTTKKATPKKAAPVKKATTSKKAAPKKVAPVKKAAAPKKVTPVKKVVVPKKAAPTKKAATPKKAISKDVLPAVGKPIKATPTEIKKVAPKVKDSTQLLADAIVEGILEVKGRNISMLNLTGIHNRVCDYFIICEADSNTQVNAIAGSVEEMVKKLTNERPYRKEGFENSEWILVDYVTVVVHVFQTQIRNFYNLESLWADAEVTKIAFDK